MVSQRRLIALTGALLLVVSAAWSMRAAYTTRIDSYASCAADGNPVSDSNPPTCRYDSSLFLGPRRLPPAGTATQAAQNVAFDLLVEGDSRGVYPKRQEVIRTDSNWQRYWREVHAALPTLPPLLPVDFTTSSVIALSEGPTGTDGYNLKVTGITAGQYGTVVDVTESIPTVTCQVQYLRTNRYFIARTPILTEPVSFRITTDYRHCQAAP